MAERPYPSTSITQHTLWTALTGDVPPLALPPIPIAHAALDSRDIRSGDLFVALAGQNTDGHAYVGRGAGQRRPGADHRRARACGGADAAGAAVVDCTRGRWAIHATLPASYQPGAPIAYVVDDSVQAIQLVGAFQRVHRTNPALRVIGVTGSVGKTSTKELTASVLRQRYTTHASPGNLNSEQGLPLALMGLGRHPPTRRARNGHVRPGRDRPSVPAGATGDRHRHQRRAGASQPARHHRTHRRGQVRTGALCPAPATAASPSSTGTMNGCAPWRK